MDISKLLNSDSSSPNRRSSPTEDSPTIAKDLTYNSDEPNHAKSTHKNIGEIRHLQHSYSSTDVTGYTSSGRSDASKSEMGTLSLNLSQLPHSSESTYLFPNFTSALTVSLPPLSSYLPRSSTTIPSHYSRSLPSSEYNSNVHLQPSSSIVRPHLPVREQHRPTNEKSLRGVHHDPSHVPWRNMIPLFPPSLSHPHPQNRSTVATTSLRTHGYHPYSSSLAHPYSRNSHFKPKYTRSANPGYQSTTETHPASSYHSVIQRPNSAQDSKTTITSLPANNEKTFSQSSILNSTNSSLLEVPTFKNSEKKNVNALNDFGRWNQSSFISAQRSTSLSPSIPSHVSNGSSENFRNNSSSINDNQLADSRNVALPHTAKSFEDTQIQSIRTRQSIKPSTRQKYQTTPKEKQVDTTPNTKIKRKRMTAEQISILEVYFGKTKFPNAKEKEELSRQLELSTRSIQVWFQNRRQAFKGKMFEEGYSVPRGRGRRGDLNQAFYEMQFKPTEEISQLKKSQSEASQDDTNATSSSSGE